MSGTDTLPEKKYVGKAAIVGRMNVGKSTLFNRLSSVVRSLTLDYAGVTRDVLHDRIEWSGKVFDLVDTGGISLRVSSDILIEKVRQQALSAVENADLVLLVIDGSVGVTHEDREIADYLHRKNKKTIIVVNKADRADFQEHVYEAQGLGYREIVPISAQHGTGIGDLLDLIVKNLAHAKKKTEDEDPAFKVVILGRPNVGKSSLMNALMQYERSIVSDIAGTTREPLTEKIAFYKHHIALTDTPGIRRKKMIGTQLETMMVKSAFGALKDTDIVLLMIDATEGALVDQDLKLAFYAFEQQHKSLVILINKSDLTTTETRASFESSFSRYARLLEKVSVLHISCKTGKNVGRVMPLIHEVWRRTQTRFSDAEISALLKTALLKRPLMRSGKRLALYNVRQIKVNPVTFLFEVNEPGWFGVSQRAFFENILRDNYDLNGVSVCFVIRKA